MNFVNVLLYCCTVWANRNLIVWAKHWASYMQCGVSWDASFLIFLVRARSKDANMIINQTIVKTLKWVFKIVESLGRIILLSKNFVQLFLVFNISLIILGDCNLFGTRSFEVIVTRFINSSFRCFKLILSRSSSLFYVIIVSVNRNWHFRILHQEAVALI